MHIPPGMRRGGLGGLLVGVVVLSVGRRSVEAAPRVNYGESDRLSDPGDDHPRPRVTLSVERFSIKSFDSRPIDLTGGRVDVFPLSERWVRGGMTAAGGVGNTDVLGHRVSMNYGLLGLTAGIQYPARVTPFVEGHVDGGVLNGRLDGTVTTAAGPLVGTSGTSWLYARGISAGSEVYTVGRLYVSASMGWVRTTWASPDYGAALQNPATTVGGSLGVTDVTTDSFIWKLGLGI